jgi:hypothetical protein
LDIKLEKSYASGLLLICIPIENILDPEKPSYPPWHGLVGYLISTSKDHESDTNTRKFESIVKIRTNDSNCSEKQTHADISNDHKQVEYEECSRTPIQSRHEVYEYTETKDIECRKGEINPDLGYP